MKIAIVDYGMGNIHSIRGALKFVGASEIMLTSDERELQLADKLILPGVGSFAVAMRNIQEKALDSILQKLVVEDKKPILGICLGMQLLTKFSPEQQPTEGLGFIEAEIEAFDTPNLVVPHVGFNQIKKDPASRLYKGLDDTSDFYFTHSFRMPLIDKLTLGICDYGRPFAASFEKGNITGVQFHPELSQTNGLTLLSNFLEDF